MLKLFRRIRLDLLAKNQFSRYALYAIGEILLVVIGILIALKINKVNEQANNRQKEQYYIKALIDEIQSDTLRYRETLIYLSAQEQAARYVHQTISSGQLPLTDSLFFINEFNKMYLGDDIGVRNPIIWSELQSTGNLSLIQDKALLKQLYHYYNSLDELSFRYNNPGVSRAIFSGRDYNGEVFDLEEVDDQLEDWKFNKIPGKDTFERIFKNPKSLVISKGIFSNMKVRRNNVGSVFESAKMTLGYLEKSIDRPH